MKVPEPGDERPLAWKAILENTPVHSANGEEIGTVAEVLGSEATDIFHGLVVHTGLLGKDIMVPAAEVRSITNVHIETDLTAEAIRDLPPFQPEESFKLGFVGLLGRHLGWVEDKDERT